MPYPNVGGALGFGPLDRTSLALWTGTLVHTVRSVKCERCF